MRCVVLCFLCAVDAVCLLPAPKLEVGGGGSVDDYDVIIGGEPAPRGTRDKPRRRQDDDRDVLDYTFGVVGGNYTFGTVPRAFVGAELGFDVPFELNNRSGRFYFSGETSRYSADLTLKRDGARAPGDDSCSEDDADGEDEEGRPFFCAPDKFDVDFDDNNVDISDAFLQYSVLDSLVVSVGRRRIVWGQFDLFSPVGILLPVRAQSLSVDFKKTNFIMPQDNVTLTWFLGERIELRGYFFLTTQLDPLLEELIEERGVRDPEDHRQYAVRGLYRPDWGTVGFTFYRGRQGVFFYENASVTGDDEIVSVPITIPITAYAAELAVPSGRWVWKAEFVYEETKSDLPIPANTIIRGNPDAMDRFSRGSGESDCLSAAGMSNDRHLTNMTERTSFRMQRQYLCSIIYRNSGSFSIDARAIFAGIGVDVRLDRWLLNLGAYFVDLRDSEQKALRQQGNNSVGKEEEGPDGDDTFVFPTLGIVRFFGVDDRYNVGFTGGFLSGAIGLALYTTARIGDNLTFYAGGDVISVLSDQYLEELEGETPRGTRYDLDNDLASGFRLGIRYVF